VTTKNWLPERPGGSAPELLLERTVTIEGRPTIQGFWVDWMALRARLLAVTADLLPSADLRPLTGVGAGVPNPLRLASIPVLLSAGSTPAVVVDWSTPAHATLAVTWLAVLAAIIAIGLVLRASMELSDRRGRFVSAVTHELRTPLTTFCLYTEMLADGMVPEGAKRQEYLATLKGESRRLAGIVENVLDFARLGGIMRPAHHEPVPAAALLNQVLPALKRRAAIGGMTLRTAIESGADRLVAADPATLERILLNLVDNACKYAGQAADRSIVITLAGNHGGVDIRVRDHGPGVPRGETRRIFLPFHRAHRDANGPQSGLGLGLALSRGLAQSLGGELTLIRDHPAGAEFTLRLPAPTRPKT